MTVAKLTRAIYGFLGVLYVVGGVGSMLMPTGWLPSSVVDRFLIQEPLSEYLTHLLQEFGTLLLAVGFTFLYLAFHKPWSAAFHWALTIYFAFDSLIHWVGPDGLIGSWSRGLINTVPPLVMVVLGLLRQRERKLKGE
jgi:hypothetical protein